MIHPLDDTSPEQFIPWMKRSMDDMSHRRNAPWPICPGGPTVTDKLSQQFEIGQHLKPNTLCISTSYISTTCGPPNLCQIMFTSPYCISLHLYKDLKKLNLKFSCWFETCVQNVPRKLGIFADIVTIRIVQYSGTHNTGVSDLLDISCMGRFIQEM
jgi:hypothetical protein